MLVFGKGLAFISLSKETLHHCTAVRTCLEYERHMADPLAAAIRLMDFLCHFFMFFCGHSTVDDGRPRFFREKYTEPDIPLEYESQI